MVWFLGGEAGAAEAAGKSSNSCEGKHRGAQREGEVHTSDQFIKNAFNEQKVKKTSIFEIY